MLPVLPRTTPLSRCRGRRDLTCVGRGYLCGAAQTGLLTDLECPIGQSWVAAMLAVFILVAVAVVVAGRSRFPQQCRNLVPGASSSAVSDVKRRLLKRIVNARKGP